MTTGTEFFPEVERVAKALLFERGMRAPGARDGCRTDARPRSVDRSELALLWELEDYFARLSEQEWEAQAAARGL